MNVLANQVPGVTIISVCSVSTQGAKDPKNSNPIFMDFSLLYYLPKAQNLVMNRNTLQGLKYSDHSSNEATGFIHKEALTGLQFCWERYPQLGRKGICHFFSFLQILLPNFSYHVLLSSYSEPFKFSLKRVVQLILISCMIHFVQILLSNALFITKNSVVQAVSPLWVCGH